MLVNSPFCYRYGGGGGGYNNGGGGGYNGGGGGGGGYSGGQCQSLLHFQYFAMKMMKSLK